MNNRHEEGKITPIPPFFFLRIWNGVVHKIDQRGIDEKDQAGLASVEAETKKQDLENQYIIPT